MTSRTTTVVLVLVLTITSLGIALAVPRSGSAASAPATLVRQTVTPDLGWTSPTPLVTQSATNSNLGGVALGGDGNGMVVYEKDNAQANIVATRFMPGGAGDAGSNWKVPVTLPTIGCGQYNPQVAMDAKGNALAVWQDYCGYAIRASLFTPSTGWGPSTLVGEPYWYSQSPQIAMNASGGAIVVWETWNGGHYDPWANWYKPGTGWGTMVRLDYGTNYTQGVSVGLDNAGNAVASWLEDEAGTYHVVVRRYTAGSGWGAWLHPETSNQYVYSSSVAVDSGGNAVLAWVEWDGGALNVWADRYDNVTGWAGAVNIESQSNAALYYVPVRTAANNGTAAVVWAMYGPAGDSQSIWANHFIRHVGWGTESDVDGFGGTQYLPTSPNVVVNSTGNATIVFQVENSGATPLQYAPYGIQYNTFTAGLSGESELDYFRTSGGAPLIAQDRAGNALAVWNYNDNPDTTQPGRNGILTNHYTHGVGWNAYYQAQSAEWDESISPGWLQLETNAAGDAIFSWTQDDGVIWNGYASIYTPAGGWSAPARIENMNYSDITEEWSAIDGQGNALVLFRTSDGTQYNVYATYYSVTTGWGTPHRLDNAAGSNKFWLRVALNRNGEGIAGWQEYNGVQWQAYTAFFNATTQTWGAPVAVQSQFDYIGSVVVGIDGNGNAMAVYQAYNGSGYTNYASYYQPASGWGTAQLLVHHSTQANVAYILAANNRGDFAAAWNEYDGTHWRSVAPVFRPATGWSTDTFVSAAGEDSSPTTPALDGVGDVLLAYEYWDGSQNDVYAAVKPAGSAWGTPVLVSSGLAATYSVTAALDFYGNGFAAWTEYNGYGYDIVARRYDANQGWLPAVTINSPAPAVPSTDTGTPVLGVDGHGNAVLGWNQWHNSALVPYAAEYIVGSGSPNLALDSPSNGAVTSNAQVSVKGITDPGASVTIDGTSVGVAANGSFGRSYSLSDGLHTFTVIATNAAGLSTVETRTVTVDTIAPAIGIASPSSGLLTRSPSVQVTGNTEPGASVTVNGVVAAVSGSGQFSVTVALQQGANTITATATDAAGNQANATVAVTLDTLPPAISITSPGPGANVTSPTVTVTGTTEPGATVVVNGGSVAVDASGHFSAQLSLSEGGNLITATATDAAGNSASAQVVVTYTNPAPAAQVQASLGSLNTMVIILLVLVIVSLGLAAFEMLQIRKLQAGKGNPPAPKPEEPAPPKDEL